MITKTYLNREDWLTARMGKVTGSKLKGIITRKGNAVKIGVYELIAERLAIPDAGDISAMQRGNMFEEEALMRFEEATGKVVNKDKVLWIREDNENIAISPDGVISPTEACEVKCLSSARHIEALLTQEIPDDYFDQALQYFVVNDELETLYFIFFDNRMTAKEFFYLTIKREDVEQNVEFVRAEQEKVLNFVDEKVAELSDF